MQSRNRENSVVGVNDRDFAEPLIASSVPARQQLQKIRWNLLSGKVFLLPLIFPVQQREYFGRQPTMAPASP
jgi:hypothetical protein